jgi:hypothetical protein
MLARFFEKYPEYAARTFLSVKVDIHQSPRGALIDTGS